MGSPMHKLGPSALAINKQECAGNFPCILQMQSIIQRSSDPEQARNLISTIDTTKHVITTQHIEVICLNRHDNQDLAPCTYEEADHVFTPG